MGILPEAKIGLVKGMAKRDLNSCGLHALTFYNPDLSQSVVFLLGYFKFRDYPLWAVQLSFIEYPLLAAGCSDAICLSKAPTAQVLTMHSLK